MDVSDATAARVEIAVDAVQRGNRSLALGVLLAIPASERVAAMAVLREFGLDPATLVAPTA